MIIYRSYKDAYMLQTQNFSGQQYLNHELLIEAEYVFLKMEAGKDSSYNGSEKFIAFVNGIY